MESFHGGKLHPFARKYCPLAVFSFTLYPSATLTGSHSTIESNVLGRVCNTFLLLIPRRYGVLKAVKYFPKQLFNRNVFEFWLINSTVHLAFFTVPSRFCQTETSSSSAKRYLLWWLRKRTTLACFRNSITYACTDLNTNKN